MRTCNSCRKHNKNNNRSAIPSVTSTESTVSHVPHHSPLIQQGAAVLPMCSVSVSFTDTLLWIRMTLNHSLQWWSIHPLRIRKDLPSSHRTNFFYAGRILMIWYHIRRLHTQDVFLLYQLYPLSIWAQEMYRFHLVICIRIWTTPSRILIILTWVPIRILPNMLSIRM